MKRDIEFLREVMLLLETIPPEEMTNTGITDEHKNQLEIADHIQQLEETGLIEAEITGNHVGIPSAYVIRRITSEGHDFIAAAKEQTIWCKAKELIKKQGGALTLAIIVPYLKKVAKEQLGLDIP